MSTDPAREEAWNCNRCRDRRVIVWNGVATPCDRCAGALPERVIKELRLVSWGPSSDGLGRLAEVGSLPLQGTEANEHGGAGAGSVGGPSHDTEPTPCAFCHRPQADGYATIGDERYCHGDDPYPTCYMKASWGMTPKRTGWGGSAHTDPCCKGGPDCLCEPEGL